MSNEVKFSAETLAVFKRLYKINQNLKIVKDTTVLRSMNETKTQMASIEIAEKLPRDFCIYDLGEFTTVLGVIENPVLDFSNDKYVTIKSENGSQKLKYMDGEANLISSFSDRVINLPAASDEYPDLKFKVTGAQLKSVMSAATALKLEYVGFKGDGESVVLTAFSRNNGSGDDTNCYAIELCETDKTFDMFYKTESLGILDGESEFTISKKRISEIVNGKAKFLIALDGNSKYE